MAVIKSNQEFGSWTYTGTTIEIGKYSLKKLSMRCNCGTIREVTVKSLMSGASRSCGRCSRFLLKPGDVFNSLTYVGEAIEIQAESQKKYRFRCECGKEKELRLFTVMRGKTKKCGDCNLVSLEPGNRIGNFIYAGDSTQVHKGSSKIISLKCPAGHTKKIAIKRAWSSRCLDCRAVVLHPGDKYGSFHYVGDVTVKIFPASKKKVLFECRCGTRQKISVCQVTNGDSVSCGRCYDRIHEWFVANRERLRSLRCPISPEEIPTGGVTLVETVENKVDCFEAICPACRGTYKPRFSDIRRGKCITCGCTTKKVSSLSLGVKKFLDDNGVDATLEYEVGGLQFDLFIPSKSILIEMHGIRWHSMPGSRNRDLRKATIAKENGLDLIVIFEDEWNGRRKPIEQILASRSGVQKPEFTIRASKCDVSRIKSAEARALYEQFHYIGPVPSAIHYGVHIKDELVAAASFRRPSRQSRIEWELSRMVMDPRFRIHGIWSKVLSQFIKHHEPESIVSFSDNRLFLGTTYEKIGFMHDGDVKPDYYWSSGSRRFHKSGLRKPHGETRTETDIRESEGYRKIWDLGKKRWVWNKNGTADDTAPVKEAREERPSPTS